MPEHLVEKQLPVAHDILRGERGHHSEKGDGRGSATGVRLRPDGPCDKSDSDEALQDDGNLLGGTANPRREPREVNPPDVLVRGVAEGIAEGVREAERSDEQGQRPGGHSPTTAATRRLLVSSRVLRHVSPVSVTPSDEQNTTEHRSIKTRRDLTAVLARRSGGRVARTMRPDAQNTALAETSE